MTVAVFVESDLGAALDQPRKSLTWILANRRPPMRRKFAPGLAIDLESRLAPNQAQMDLVASLESDRPRVNALVSVPCVEIE
jgi:hypothetical protein